MIECLAASSIAYFFTIISARDVTKVVKEKRKLSVYLMP